MIKANELRIGNYISPVSKNAGIHIPCYSVKYKVGAIDKFGVVKIIDPSKYQNITLKYGEYCGITITHEWLERFGFENRGNNLFVNGKIELRHYRGRNDVLVRGINVSYNYIHQLQNLYFALTGEELEYNHNI